MSAAATTSGKTKTTGKVMPSRPPVHTGAAHQTANGSVMKKNNNGKPGSAIPSANGVAIVQPKVIVGKPNDSFEQQADAMAAKVLRMGPEEIARNSAKKGKHKNLQDTSAKARTSLQKKDQPGAFLMRSASAEKEKVQKSEGEKVQQKAEEKVLKASEKNVQMTAEKVQASAEEKVRKTSEVDKQKKIEKIEKKEDPKLQKNEEKKVQKADEKIQKTSEVDKQKKIEKIEKKEDPKLQKNEEKKAQKSEEKVQKISEVDKQKRIEKIEKKEDPKLQKNEEKKVQKSDEKVQKISEVDKQKRIEKIEKKEDPKLQKSEEKFQKKEEEKIQKAEAEKKKVGEEKILKKADEKVQTAPLPPVLKTQEKIAARPVTAPAPPVQKKEEEKIQKADDKLQKASEKHNDEKIRKSPEKIIQPFADKMQAKAVTTAPVQKKEEEKIQKTEDKLQKATEKLGDEKIRKTSEKSVQPMADKIQAKAIATAPVQKKEEEKIQKSGDEKIQKAETDKVQKKTEEKINRSAEQKVQTSPVQATSAPAAATSVLKKEEEKIHKKDEEKVAKSEEQKVHAAREQEMDEQLSSEQEARLMAERGGGNPLPAKIRSYMENRFGVNFGAVRIHTDSTAAQLCMELGAQAFAWGNHIFFARGKYQPDTEEGKFLLAHELTHVIQQGFAPETETVQQTAEKQVAKTEDKVQKASEISSTTPRIQRLGLSDILDGLAALAANIPGFTLLTVIIGRNPINMESVDRSPVNILRGFIGLIPGGEILFQVLNTYNVATRIANWIAAQVAAMGISFSSLRDAFTRFTDSLSWSDIFSPGDVWRRAKDIFTPIITRIVNFVESIISQAIAWLKETFMQPLSDFCRQVPGYTLVTVLLGRDPFTNAAVPRTAMNVVKAFAEFIPGGTEKVQELEESKGLQKAYDWFITETQSRNLTWDRVAGTFQTAWDTLKLEDILSPIATLRRVAGIFSPLMSDLVGFAGAALMKLLEIIYEAVMGAGGALVLSIIKKSAATFKTIIQNPVGFLGNLVKAIGMGIRQFAGNILKHLQTGVITWLTGTLTKAGVQLPEKWDLAGILKFILQLLGLTYPRIRGVAVEVFGERIVGTLETVAGLIMDIREKGFVQTIKDRVSEFFSGLKEMVLGQIKSFIQERIVMAGIAQLVSLLSPVGAVIQAIIKTYQTVMFFVQKINQILEFVNSIVNSIAAIAAGSLGAAANYVEQTMARTIPLILDFLARMIGLGDISGKIKSLIEKAQEFIMGKVRQAMMWVKTQLTRLLQTFAGGKKPEDRLKAAVKDAEAVLRRKKINEEKINAELPKLKEKHKLQDAKLIKSGEDGYKIEVFINPKLSTPVVANENYPGSGLDPTLRTVDELWKDVDPKNKLTGETKQTESSRRAKIAELQLLTRYSGANQAMAKELLKHQKGQSLKPVGNIRAHEGPGHTISRHVLNGGGQIKDKKDLALRVYTGQPGNPGKAGAYKNQASASSSVKQAVNLFVAAQTWDTFRKTMLNNPTNFNANVPAQPVTVSSAVIYKKSATPVPPAHLPKYLDGSIYTSSDAHGTIKKAFHFGTTSGPLAPPVNNINYPAPIGIRQLYPGDSTKYVDATTGKKKIVIPPPIVDPDAQTTVFVRLIIDSGKPGGYYINSSWPQ